MPDIFIYNGGQQTQEIVASYDDLLQRRSILVPPATQAQIPNLTQVQADTINAFLENSVGVVKHETIAAPVAFTGVSHSANQVQIPGKAAVPVKVAPTPTLPKPTQSQGKSK